MISAVASAPTQDAIEASTPAAPVDVATPATSGDRRGALRPGSLASPRARMEAAGAERGFRLAESIVIVSLALALAHQVSPAGLLAASVGQILPMAGAAVALVFALKANRAYSISRREALRRSLARASASLLVGGACLAALLLLLPPGVEAMRATGAWFVLSAASVMLLHLVWWRRVQQLRRDGKLTPNIIIVGATPNAERLIEQATLTGDVAVLGIFDDRIGRVADHIGGVRVLGDTASLLDHRIMPYVDRVVITVPARAQGRVRQLIEKLRVLPNEVSLFLDINGEVDPAATLSRLAQAPLAKVSGHQLDEARQSAKRLQDIVLGSLALLAAAPIMLLVAIAIRLDSPGPIFFRQRRHGFNNEAIVVWKFRSMRHETADATASRQISANDDRVTRVGRFIRKTSLDELPQLFNVLTGEMSLVGPRPHAIGMKTGDQESALLVAEYAHRHRMKPGVTGWAAINGSRGPVDTPADVRRRVTLDVEYIERQSFWLDLYILAMTIPCLLGDRDAVR
jgi:polysaccharide biosynthesis protein PslA